MVQIFGRRHLKRKDLAPLRVDPGHDVLDGAVLAGGIHRLEDEQQRPLALGVKLVLKFRQRLDALGQRFFGFGFALVFVPDRVGGIEILQVKFFAVINPEGFGERPGFFDDFFRFHDRTAALFTPARIAAFPATSPIPGGTCE